MNYARELEKTARRFGGKIEAVVIGNFGWGDSDAEPTDDARAFRFGTARTPIPADRKGEVLTWRQAKPLLNYDYYDGFGAPDCHYLYAWTATHVLGIHEYDGSTTIVAVPRDPTPGLPHDI